MLIHIYHIILTNKWYQVHLLTFADNIKIGEIENTEWSQGSLTGPLGLVEYVMAIPRKLCCNTDKSKIMSLWAENTLSVPLQEEELFPGKTDSEKDFKVTVDKWINMGSYCNDLAKIGKLNWKWTTWEVI